jgi:hypothetical protein
MRWTSSYFGYQGGLQGNNKADSATVQEVISIVCDEFQRCKDKQNGGDFTYASAGGTSQKQKPRKCATCGRTNHVMANCRFKGKPKCGICDRFGHNDKDCWKNPLNKGKGKATFGRDNRKPDFKDKPRANVNKDDSDSDTEQLQKSFIANVSIDNESELKGKEEAQFSAYSWIADSGATTHICVQRDCFSEYRALPNKVVTGLGDQPVIAYGQGTVTIRTRADNRDNQIRLTDTLHVPEASENLISLGRIDAAGGRATCAQSQIKIYDTERRKIALGHL